VFATKLVAATIDAAWEDRASMSPTTRGDAREAVETALKALDTGDVRVAEKNEQGQWVVNQWLKKAVLLSFRLNPNKRISNGPGDGAWWDKVPSKFSKWADFDFAQAGFRSVPGALVRYGAFVAKDAVLMEPLQANPVIIEDNCFVGARSEVAEGVIVREGSVIGMGVYLGQSTPIIHRETGETLYGEVPPYSVVVAGNRPGTKNMPGQNWTPSLYCAVIVKQVDAGTRAKTSVNELLRT
jgi:2,3,4,5-tetrahydropyridine-2-carboxylate N-succinyltransferase